jgi:hypothetical protein
MYSAASTSVAVSKSFAGRADAQGAQPIKTAAASRMATIAPVALVLSG